MTKREYQKLEDPNAKPCRVSLSDLKNKNPRTLLWGYTTDRASWHVYIQYESIHVYCYEGWDNKPPFHTHATEWDPDELVPNKRLYPEACDFEFCQLLKKHGVYLPFTTWNDNRLPAQFYGEVK